MLKKFNPTSRISIIGDLYTSCLNHLLSLMNSYNFRNSVCESTHNHGSSSILIDVVFSNNNDTNKTIVLPCPFSNHSFVLCNAKFFSSSLTKSSVFGRVINEKNLAAIRELLASEINRFDTIDLFDDVNDNFFAQNDFRANHSVKRRYNATLVIVKPY